MLASVQKRQIVFMQDVCYSLFPLKKKINKNLAKEVSQDKPGQHSGRC